MCFLLQALCLSSSAMGKTTTGQIVNLLSNDVNKFDDVREINVVCNYLKIWVRVLPHVRLQLSGIC